MHLPVKHWVAVPLLLQNVAKYVKISEICTKTQIFKVNPAVHIFHYYTLGLWNEAWKNTLCIIKFYRISSVLERYWV